MKEIFIFDATKEYKYEIKVDDEDYEKVNQFTWSLNSSGYALSNKNVFMHHLLIGNKSSEGLVVDHINQNKLDNRKENLHHVTRSQNSQNCTRKNKLNFMGIYETKNKKYVAKIRDSKNKKVYQSKITQTAIDAAKKYDILALHIYGEKALTNRLIKFEDAKKIDINDIISKPRERELPKYIFKSKSNFFVKRSYKTFFFKKRVLTLAEALVELEKINNQILKMKIDEINRIENLQPTKDDKGCYIVTKKNIKIYVDEKYWHKLIQYTWNLDPDGYAISTIDKKQIKMHRLILEKFEKKEISYNYVIDHINHDRIDNRVENLRIVSHSVNNQNRKKKQGTLSNYIGVSHSGRKWRSSIIFQKKKYDLGTFQTEEDAAKAYNIKALEIYGNKAKINLF